MVRISVLPVVCRLRGEITRTLQANLSSLLSYDVQSGYMEKEKSWGRRDRQFIPIEKTLTLFDRENKEFPTGVLPRVCRFFDKIGEHYEIDDQRIELDADHVMPLALEATMRPYQQQAIDIAVREKRGIIRAATGAGKCVGRDTLVWSKGLHRFEDLFEKAETIAGPHRTNKIVGWWDDGTNPGFRIETANGQNINGTSAHRIWIRKHDGFEGWCSLQEIQIGDFVGLARGRADWGNSSVSEEDAYIFGLIISDGYLRKQNGSATLQIDKQLPVLESIAPRIREWSLKNGGTGNVSIKEKSENHAALFVYGAWLIPFLKKSFGFSPTPSHLRSIPSEICKSPKKVVCAFLRGLFDGDGWVDRTISWSSSSRILARQVQAILLGIGIFSSLSRKHPAGLTAYVIHILDPQAFDDHISMTLYGLRKDNSYIKLLNLPRNTNVDIVPGVSSALQEGWNLIPDRAGKSIWKIAQSYLRGERNPSYQKIKSWIENSPPGTFPTLERLAREHRAWSPVVRKTPSEIERIDCEVQGSHAFVGNGIINHNTRMMAGIVAALERSAVILVHRLDLMHQVLEVLQGLMLFPEIIGRVGQGVYEPNVITIMTVQTACVALGINYEKSDLDDDETEMISGAKLFKEGIQEALQGAQVVVVDEVHHCPSRTIAEVLKRCENATWRIGLSATDWRDDGLDLLIEAAFGSRIFDVSLSDLVDLGFLVPAQVTMYPQPFDGIVTTGVNFSTAYRAHYTDNTPFHEQVLARNKQWHDQGRYILTLVKMIKHGIILEQMHKEAGIETVFLHGKVSTGDRKSTLDAMRDGRLRHIIGTSIADEGLDIPILDAIHLAGGGGSTTQAYQRIGRAVRTYEGKEFALVADYRPSHPMLERHALTRARIYKKERCFEYKEIKK